MKTRPLRKVLPALCLIGFAACTGSDGFDAQHQSDTGAGGQSGAAGDGSSASGNIGGVGGASVVAGSGGLGVAAGGGLPQGGQAEGGLGGADSLAGEGGVIQGDVAGGGVTGEGGAGGDLASAGAPPMDDASLVMLELDQRPYTECEAYKIGAFYATDANGIPLKLYHNEYYYNPTLIAQAGLEWLSCYRGSGDAWYLDQARKAGHFLVSVSEDFDGAMFFPYSIDFHLHSSATEIAWAPWYSGMAQGQVLSFFSRLKDQTSEPEWAVDAAMTFKSFERQSGRDSPWVVDVDAENSLWIEEYADTPDSHVLNGFMFAMFGLYDYYASSKDERAAEIFRQSLHTLRVNAERFRNVGDVSAYCLTHRVQSTSYHAIHIMELNAITRMTNDPYFSSVADMFAADYTPPPPAP